MIPNADIFEWDVHNWSKAMKLWSPTLKNVNGGKALTLGERGGGLSLMLASHGMDVICTDINPFDESTSELHKKHGLSERVDYMSMDMTNLEFDDNSFDVVMFKSVIGALGSKDKQQRAISEIYRVLKPRGTLLFAENCSASFLHRWARKRFTNWDSYWRYPHYKNDRDLFDSFKEEQFKSYGFLGAFGRSEGQRRILGKMDNVFEKLTPASNRYIMVGRLVK